MRIQYQEFFLSSLLLKQGCVESVKTRRLPRKLCCMKDNGIFPRTHDVTIELLSRVGYTPPTLLTSVCPALANHVFTQGNKVQKNQCQISSEEIDFV